MRGDKLPTVRGNGWNYPFYQNNVGKTSVNDIETIWMVTTLNDVSLISETWFSPINAAKNGSERSQTIIRQAAFTAQTVLLDLWWFMWTRIDQYSYFQKVLCFFSRHTFFYSSAPWNCFVFYILFRIDIVPKTLQHSETGEV